MVFIIIFNNFLFFKSHFTVEFSGPSVSNPYFKFNILHTELLEDIEAGFNKFGPHVMPSVTFVNCYGYYVSFIFELDPKYNISYNPIIFLGNKKSCTEIVYINQNIGRVRIIE